MESTGAIVTQAKGSKQDFKVEAERQFTYSSGITKLEEVRVISVERGGQDFEITSKEASIGADQAEIKMSGNVELKVSGGLRATTDNALYDDNDEMLRIPSPVEFVQDRISGSGLEATYDQKNDELRLLGEAQVLFMQNSVSEEKTEIFSESALLARSARYMRFDGDVKIIRPHRIIEAMTATAYFEESSDRISLLELRGESRISSAPNTSSSLKEMSSAAVDLFYEGEAAELRRATLNGEAKILLSGGADGEDYYLFSDWIDLIFAPGKETLTTLNAREKVYLNLPGNNGEPSRVIRSSYLTSDGTDASGLEVAMFEGSVVFRESLLPFEAKKGFERTAYAQTLRLSLDGGFDSINEAHFLGNAEFEDKMLHATAPEALYRLGVGVLELISADRMPRPVVTDADTEIEAAEFEMALNDSTMRAAGDVRTTYGTTKDSLVKQKRGRMPGMFKPDESVHVIGQELHYDSERGHALYIGDARLWQGRTAIRGGVIEIDSESGDLLATESARSTLMLETMNKETQVSEEVESVAKANSMHYEDALRRITYEKEAYVTGPQGNVNAEKIELYLGKKNNSLERAEAYEDVTLKADLRDATGKRLTYFTADERYLMNGTPVIIVEKCRETKGKTLTFYKSIDTITMHGNEEIRTESKSGADCPEPSNN
jgi:LPS export ABC transporter protein LptC